MGIILHNMGIILHNVGNCLTTPLIHMKKTIQINTEVVDSELLNAKYGNQFFF